MNIHFLKTSLAMILILWGSLVTAATNHSGQCPREPGEIDSCSNEQKIVTRSIRGLKIHQTLKYCKEGTTSTEEISCRQMVTYKNITTGQPSQSIFEDWLIIALPETSTSPKGLFTARIVFVQNSQGLYDVFWDDEPTSQIKVDRVLMDKYGSPIQSNVHVNFDNSGLPSFDLPGLNVSTGEVVLLGISYSIHEVRVNFIGTGRQDIFPVLSK